MTAEKKVRAAVYLIVALFFLFFQANLVNAQNLTKLPRGLKDDPYISGLDSILNKWNKGSLDPPTKKQLKPKFENYLKWVVDRGKYEYQDGRWADSMHKKFSELSPRLKLEGRLTDDAKALLLLLFSMQLDVYKKNVPLHKLNEQIDRPLFMILSTSLAATDKAGKRNIGVNQVLESIFSWWTTIWPFCR